MYSIAQRLLVENPINRYSIGGSTPGLKSKDAGSLTIYVSGEIAGKDKESNWLPDPHSRVHHHASGARRDFIYLVHTP